MSRNVSETTSVIVVGGGLAGLCTALFLRAHAVPVVNLERHAQSSLHPRAIGYTPRTMELFRSVGLGPPKIPEAPASLTIRRARVKSLTGEWFEETPWTPQKNKEGEQEKIQYSPVCGAAVAQDSLEPILRDRARELGADVRMSHKMLNFTQDENGVTVSVQDPSGKEYTIRAQYLVACDGYRSHIREALGIKCSGRGYIKTLRSVLFRAPQSNDVLDKQLEKGVSQFNIDQPDFQAFMTTYRDGRWVLMFEDDTDPSEKELLQQVEKAVGRSDLDYEIITTGRWDVTGLIAERFSEGRVFLAGDAAHTLPPNRGGYGANTGIQDAHNLAWKLGAVISGVSSPKLLESYDTERRPVAWLRHEQLFMRADYEKDAMKSTMPEGHEKPIIIDDEAIEFGQIYRSSAVLGAGEELLPARRPEEWLGQPGTRAPHLWVMKENDDEKISILDVFQKGWVLLFEDGQWSAAAKQAGHELGVEVEAVKFGKQIRPADGNSTKDFLKWYGLGPRGSSLVRPDGYIAWRAVDTSPGDTTVELASQLTYALGTVLSAMKA